MLWLSGDVPKISILMEAVAEPLAFLILISYAPVSARFASLIKTPEYSVVVSTDNLEVNTSSFPFFNHSMVGRGSAMIPTLSLILAPALYCTTSRYSGGRSIAGAPGRR